MPSKPLEEPRRPSVPVRESAVCPYCGQAGRDAEGHASLQSCRKALRRRLEDLAARCVRYQEAGLSGTGGLEVGFGEVLAEMEAVRERFLVVDRLIRSIETASRRGTESSWREVLEAAACWEASFSPMPR